MILAGIVWICRDCPFTTQDPEKSTEHGKLTSTTVKGTTFQHHVVKFDFSKAGT